MLKMPESQPHSTLNGLQKKPPASGLLTIHITPSVLTGETIEVIGTALAKKPIFFMQYKTCVTHTDSTEFRLLDKTLSLILMHYDLRIGLLSVSRMIPSSCIIRYTHNSRTALGFSRRSIRRILSTRMNLIRGEKEVLLTIS